MDLHEIVDVLQATIDKEGVQPLTNRLLMITLKLLDDRSSKSVNKSLSNVVEDKMYEILANIQKMDTDDVVAEKCAKVAEDVAIAYCKWVESGKDYTMVANEYVHQTELKINEFFYKWFITQVYGK